MNTGLEREIREWLDAEGMSADVLAEQALGRAFAELGRRAPASGFADRVVLRTRRGAVSSVFWRSRWVRAAVASWLTAAGLAIATLPLWWLVADPLARALGSPLVPPASRAVAWVFGAVVTSWNVIQGVISAFRAVLMTPPVLALLSASALLAAASLLGLKRLLRAPQESMP